jgi:hypothetical protein
VGFLTWIGALGIIGGGVASDGCGDTGVGGGTLGNGDAAATRGTGTGAVLGITGARGCVAGIAGVRARCWMGSTDSGRSTLPLCTKILACGLATMTRGGGGIRRPDDVVRSPAGSGSLRIAGRGGGTEEGRDGGAPCVGAFCGKRGVVLALAGAPVSGGAEGFGGSGVTGDVILEMLGIGLVTAVDHAGGTLLTGAGSNWPVVFIGRVEAADTFGLGVGVIFAVGGLSGRGGKLMRKVSRFGAFGSEPSGVAESAIINCFYSYSGKCSMVKFAIVTYL